MDDASRDWFRMHLQNLFYRHKREQFQQLVCDILEVRYPGDFKRIRQGTRRGGGDGGCDGFRPSTGTAYAVYAPRETDSSTLKAKIERDFEKAMALFAADLREWIFVHNDADGLNSDVVLKALLALKKSQEGNIVVGNHMSFNELWNLVQELTFDRICEFLPRPPTSSDTFVRLRFEQLRPVLQHLQQVEVPGDAPLEPVSPKKLEYNKLPVLVADFLHRGRRLSSVVDSYFRGHHDPELGDRIATGFRRHYATLREQRLEADQVFTQLFEFAGGYDAAFKTIESQAAVGAVLAYFFDRCDIFENAPTEA